MTTEQITQLAALAADIAEIDPSATITKVEMAEMADGSRRHFALVHTYDKTNDLEQTFRVATAAPEGGPSWTWKFNDVSIEVMQGDSWLVIA